MRRIEAPWSPEVVQALNCYQQSGWHPFTCGALDRTTGNHADYQALVGGDYGQLVATKDGWVCAVCGYRQNWAYEVQLEIGAQIAE